MATGSAAVSVAKPLTGSGGIFVAPAGTPVPTSYDEALDAAFVKMGYISEDGVTRTEDADSDDKFAWGGDAVADLPGQHSITYAATFLESGNADLLKALYGDEAVSVDATSGEVTITGTSKRPPRSVYVIETDVLREVIPIGQLNRSGDVQYVDSEVIQYEASIKAYPDAAGAKYFTYRKGDATGGDESGEG
jgi:hypothetical protein